MKRIYLFTFLLCLFGQGFAQTLIDGIYYNLGAYSSTAKVTWTPGGVDKYSGSISIPESVTYEGKEYSVTSIGGLAFSECSGLTSVTIPNSVTYIGESAFSDCTGLTSLTIPNSVTLIGHGAFFYCTSLTSIVVEEGNPVYDSRESCNAIINTFTNELVAGCKTTVIPDGVTSIGKSAFTGCSGLTSITIPNSVTFIGFMAFSGCSDLTSIVVEEDNPVYDSRESCNAIVKTSTNELVKGCKATIIPNSVKSIGVEAFSGCTGLTSIIIPNSVTSIGREAFEDCSGLTSVTIPNSVTYIGELAFLGCSGLTSLTMNPATPPSLGGIDLFSGCKNLSTIYVPNEDILLAYEAVAPWNNYNITIVESGADLTGIEAVEMEGET